MNRDDIRPQHWQRLAYVYIRQSSLHQVLHHRESRRRQQAFKQRAQELGWPADRIRVVEEDLAQSGARHQRRSGFEDLVAQVALAAVGLILALEVSRLARGNRDWYHLLDICSITGTLIADAEGLYDPREYNDRLLLGLKGTLGEAELHLMKQRLVEAMRAKAARGEFRFRLPPGYFWDEAGRMQKEVDAQVRSALEAMIEAATTYERASEAQREQLQQRRQRARYEVDLARRQYEAVDPAHRLVAQELERRWEQALEDLERVEEQTEEQLRVLERPLEPEEQQRLRHWSRDLGRLWREPTTRVQDKKRLLRCLIEQVVVRVEEEAAELQAQVHWVGGEVTPVAVSKRKRGEHRWVTDPELVELIRTLAQEFSDEQIAWILSTKRLRTSKGLPFTATRVSQFRYHHGLPGTKQARLDDDHVYSPEQAAELLEVNRGTVIRWIQAGLLRGSQLLPVAPWKVEVTEADLRRLKATNAPPGWLPLKGAALALGVSQQTVLQRLKSGQLEGVRVRVGGRSSWRIQVPSTTYDKQPPLFSESTP